jgi:CRP-like cAMP-binding protein
MNEQGSLFGDLELRPAPTGDPLMVQTRRLSRRADPSSSKQAARRAVETGTVRGHQGRILAVFRPGVVLTGVQIAERAGLTQWQVMRRMKEMVDRGLLTSDAGVPGRQGELRYALPGHRSR